MGRKGLPAAAHVQSGAAIAGPLYIEASTNPRSGSCIGQVEQTSGRYATRLKSEARTGAGRDLKADCRFLIGFDWQSFRNGLRGTRKRSCCLRRQKNRTIPHGAVRFHQPPSSSERFGKNACRSEEHTSELQSLMRISY